MSIPAAQLSRSVYDQLLSYVGRRVSPRADAEDLVQQILLRVAAADAPSDERFRPWLFRVARNAVIDAYRQRARQCSPDAAAWLGPLPVESQAGASPELPVQEPLEAMASYLQGLLEHLTAADRDVLEQVDLGGTSQREYARKNSLPYPTAKARVQRARLRLRKELERHCTLQYDARGMPMGCTPRLKNCCS